MDGVKSREALLHFIDWTGEKGLMQEHTVRGRRAAASQMLGILDDTEAADITVIDIDDLADRFHRKNMQKYTPGSVAAYKSRLRATIVDFVAYLDSPTTFRPSSSSRMPTAGKSGKNAYGVSTDRPAKVGPLKQPMPPATTNVVPIPIRADLTVFVQGLPFNLTLAEARKISAVVAAMVMPDEP